jgi:putative esterase
MNRKIQSLAGLVLLSAGLLIGCSEDQAQRSSSRRYEFRAIGGVSMGAMTAAQLGLRYHEKFDILAPSGGGIDFTLLAHWFRDDMLGGFCSPPEVGKMCRAPDKTQDYEHMDCGGPMGGGFDRRSMIEAFQDMFIAFGNMASFNPEHPYLPVGVGEEYFELSKEEKCENPIRLPNFYDWEFNPDGDYPAITYCERDGPEQGIFDPSLTPNSPVEIALAIDVNDNGVRDSGEPVLFRMTERYDDFGEDGLPSPEEPGYDSNSNPDPSGDDYHRLDNPFGTENNHIYDDGEPYLDYGLDGVKDTADSPYDWGEGNGHFDFNLNVLRTAVMYNPARLVEEISLEDLDRLDFYIDAGIRDHLGFMPTCESFVGKMGARGRPFDIRDKYISIMRADYDGPFKIHEIDWDNIGRDLFIRYGNPDATQAEIDAGDGGHVGNGSQLFYRIFSMIAFASERWPDGDFEKVEHTGQAQVLDRTYYSEILGMDRQYYIYLPPGYDDNPDKSYPVFYLIHGIGMDAEVLTTAVLFADPWMADGTIQKFIMVFPDGRCQDDCMSGNFFVNQMGRHLPPRRYEDSFKEELLPHIEQTYRTRPVKEYKP